MAKKPSPPQVFNGNEYHNVVAAIEKMAHTQLGALQDTYNADDLTLLFVPLEYRKALKLVYEVEDDSRSRGEIWIDLISVLGQQMWVFESGGVIEKATMRIYFHRDWMPDGFVTPSPLFGTRERPIKSLQGLPPGDLGERFRENSLLLLRIACEWALVRWVTEGLQNSLRTPQQMRYVWPATYNIAQAAGLKMDLSTPSARAGINAVPAPNVQPFMRDTNDVVANSVLLGIVDEHITRFNRKAVTITDATIKVHNGMNVSYRVPNV